MKNLLKFAILTVLAASAALPAAAVTSGPNSTVVYIGGNDLVLKASDGTILNYVIPAGFKFTAAGKPATLADLKPGTKLTAEVNIGVDPVVVADIKTAKAKVYAVNPPDGLTLIMSDGSKDFSVPTGTTFTVDGKPTPFSALKADAMVEVTVITPAAEGAEPAPAPATPPLTGALIVEKGEDLPSAGTHLPLYGVLGLTMLLAGFALLAFRKPAQAI
jgi:hypothetical protein